MISTRQARQIPTSASKAPAAKDKKRAYDAARYAQRAPMIRTARAEARLDPAGAIARISEREKLRFWKFVERRPDGCWLWRGSRDRIGYGHFRSRALASSGVLAHRYSWFIHHGPVLDGLDVCHRCDVPGCVNPQHLFLGTHTDNMRDMFAKKRRRILRGSQLSHAVLTEEDVREIRRKRAAGASLSELSERFGLAKSNICAIAKRRRWKHVE